jgi:hypothetical protein
LSYRLGIGGPSALERQLPLVCDFVAKLDLASSAASKANIASWLEHKCRAETTKSVVALWKRLAPFRGPKASALIQRNRGSVADDRGSELYDGRIGIVVDHSTNIGHAIVVLVEHTKGKIARSGIEVDLRAVHE